MAGEGDDVAIGGVMTLSEMHQLMQNRFGKPLALRKKGSTRYKCPYCSRVHRSGPGVDYVAAECTDESGFNGAGIVIGSRSFTNKYGVKIMEYEEVGGVNRIIDDN